MSEKRYVIGLDEGTTSARAVVYDIKTNKIISIYGEPFKQFYPRDGWVEQDAEEIYSVLMKSVKKVISDAKISLDQILSVGLTNQRETIVAFNKQTGKPIYNAIVWQCHRTEKEIKKLTEKEIKTIKEKTGLVADPYFSASKMQWIMNNVKDAKKLLKEHNLLIGTIDSYIAYKLTGNFVTDTSNASRTMLFNINTMKWDKELLDMWQIEKECLPKVVCSSEIVGEIKELNNIPLSSIIGDQQSSLVGHGCLKPGETKITYGTGGFMLFNTGDKKTDANKILTTIAYTVNGKTTYALEGSIFSACSALDWAQNNLKLFENVAETEKIAKSVNDNGGVYFIPAFTGLGAPYWNSSARGTFAGINFASNRNHFVRAILESFGYGTKAIANQMETSGLKLKSIKVDGGGSKNNFILQFLSDILGIEVLKSESSECTVLGAIYFSMLAMGKIKFNDILTLAKHNKSYTPTMSKSKREEQFNIWNKFANKCD